MAIKSQDKTILIIKSGGLCGICNQALISSGVESDKPIGEIAHIKGDKLGSARHDADMSDDDRNSYNNLFYLCPSCHTKIDKDESTYTSDWLYAKKESHEQEVDRRLKELTLDMSYFELEHTLRHLAKQDYDVPEESLKIIPPKDKIKKNNLSEKVEGLLQVGLLQSSQIEDFLNKNAEMDYASKIRNYFVSTYLELKSTGLEADELFYALWNKVNRTNSEAKYLASALSVLAYYFYLCEVFEK